jgi:hypothetical protein
VKTRKDRYLLVRSHSDPAVRIYTSTAAIGELVLAVHLLIKSLDEKFAFRSEGTIAKQSIWYIFKLFLVHALM